MTDLQPGTIVFDKYEIERLLGYGGMGQVYLARDKQLGRQIALKTLSRDLKDDEENRARFIHEARLASALNHPNILTVYEIGTIDDVLFMATEFVPGKTLRELTQDERLTLDQVIDISIQAAKGLAAAHEAGIIHRDLKLENFMLRNDGYLKILDFGLAKLTAGSLPGGAAADFVTQAGMVLGTPNYMSPEQARGQALDARSDIFSFGAVLYELLSGWVAFEADSSVQVLFNVIYQEPDELPDYVPAGIREIVARALKKDPAARYQTMREMLDALSALRDRAQHAPESVPVVSDSAPAATTESVSSKPSLIFTAPQYEQFIGRSGEFNLLKVEFDKSSQGRSRCALVMGAQGAGKTELLNHFQRWAREQQAIAVSTNVPGETVAQFGQVFLPLLANLLAIKDSGSYSINDAQMAERVAQEASSRFGINLPVNYFQADAPVLAEADKWQLFDALRQMFQRVMLDRQIVLLFDNLHLAESISLELLGYLMRSLNSAPLLIVASANVEEATTGALREWLLAQARYTHLERITLKPFQPAQVHELLKAIFKRIEISEQAINRLYESTGGNARYLVEVIRMLVNKNKFVFREGWWHSQSFEELELPETLGIATQFKLEQCDEELRELLRQAAVLGDSINFDLLAVVTEKSEDELDQLLEKAARAFLLLEEKGNRGDDFRFYDATIRRVLYEGMSKRQRRKLHQKAAHAIEQFYQGKTARVAGTLAYHYNAAGEWARTIEYSLQAIEQEWQRERWNEVAKYARWVEEAATALQEADEEHRPVDERLLTGVKIKLANALMKLTSFESAMTEVDAALARAERLGSKQLMARAKVIKSNIQWFMGRFKESSQTADEGLSAAREANDDFAERHLNFQAGFAKLRSGAYAESLSHLQQASDTAEANGDTRLMLQARIFYGVVLHLQGRWREAASHLGQALETARAAGDRFVECRTISMLVMSAFYERRHADVTRLHGQGVQLTRELGWRIGEAYLHLMQGGDYLAPTNLNIELGIEYLQRGLIICHETGEKGFQLSAMRALARADMFYGNTRTAIEKLKTVLTLLKQFGDITEQWATYCYLGEVYEMIGDNNQALATFTECCQLAERAPFPFWHWQALYGCARTLQVLGRDSEAKEKLVAACDIATRLRGEFDEKRSAEKFVEETAKAFDMLATLEKQ